MIVEIALKREVESTSASGSTSTLGGKSTVKHRGMKGYGLGQDRHYGHCRTRGSVRKVIASHAR